MKSDTKLTTIFSVITLLWLGVASQSFGDTLRESVLRNAAIKNGLVPVEETHVKTNEASVAAGKLIFQSKKLSLNLQTACASCHLDRFGSADGLPNAIGTEGAGEGMDRLQSGGEIIPRNAMPFWGVGGIGYDVLFWDGKIDGSSGTVSSQFGDESPSSDPLIVAVHIPPVEIGEMLSDSIQNDELKTESVATAEAIYKRLLEQLLDDGSIREALLKAAGESATELQFLDVAEAVASFIRNNFELQSTRFHDFVFGEGKLEKEELAGGLVFYGKGKCAGCHNGAYFSDMKFHAVPFQQAGFGKNGFGVDYGRYNVTLDPDDRYKFRTPPLYNVSKTSPYSHSGSIADLGDAIRAHIDPLSTYDPSIMSDVQRVQFYEQLKAWSKEPLDAMVLNGEDIDALVSFLGTLEYDSKTPVQVDD